MSLLFESAIGDFDLAGATLYSPADGDLYEDLHAFLEHTGRLRRVEPEFIPIPE